MTETLLVILVAVMAVGFGLILRFLIKQKGGGKENQSFLLLQNQMNEIARTLDTKLGESTR